MSSLRRCSGRIPNYLNWLRARTAHGRPKTVRKEEESVSDYTLLPVHPRTGFTALAIGKRGPIWPVAGASEDHGGDDAGAGADAVDDIGELTPPAANDWWQFTSKEDAEAWGNKLVTNRLARVQKTKLDPVTAERDTLNAEVERLRPLEAAGQTDSQRWESEKATLVQEVSELRDYKAQNERANLVRQIAEEEGLPARFVGRVSGDDEDAIRDDIKDLLNVLSEGGSNTGKKTPPAKSPKGSDSQGAGSMQSGGGGNAEASDADLTASILEDIAKDRSRGGLHTRR